jgi:hypothetical protein
MATQDYGTCDTCGNPITEDEDFTRRADMINAALDGVDEETVQILLAMFAGRHLSRFVADVRKRVRRDLHKEIDRETMDWVVAGCDS